ncbi:MAG: acylphosphatase [Sporocytophaga sp.]|nr:acylphosphatase [Sporocytophaga sp.]
MKNFRIVVSGKVQGVFFRASARSEAKAQNLVGFAKNLPDGNVLIEAMGEEESLEKFLQWCSRGPMMAHVTSVNTEEIPLGDFTSFDISY